MKQETLVLERYIKGNEYGLNDQTVAFQLNVAFTSITYLFQTTTYNLGELSVIHIGV
jgi:hypothetical protein